MLQRFLEDFGTAMLIAVIVVAIAALAATILFLAAVIGVARGRPSVGLGVVLSIVGACALGYAAYAALSGTLLPQERTHHIVDPVLGGLVASALGVTHLRMAKKRKELAFLDANDHQDET